MDNNESINSITDIEVLRGYLHETTQRLQTAAQMGLELAQQNSALQSRLGAIEQTQDDMRQRLALVERDRRWMQDQSLRVDQIKASLNDIILKANGSRSHRCDQQIDRLDYAIEKLKDDINAVAQTLESVVSTRKWTTEMSAARKSLAELTDKVATLEVRLKEVQEQANTTETRHRSHHAELTRCLNENTQNIQTISEERSEAQAHINSVASHQRDIEQSLQSVIHEYNAMLNEHEQAIRVLSESHALLEAQTMAHHAHSSQYYTNSSTPSTLTPGIGKYQQILPARYSITPVSGTPKHSSTYKKRDSGIGDVQTKRPPMKQCESLDDIFANDQHDASKQKEQLGAFPSPPLSTAGEPILDLSVLGRTPVRKAASVIGTPSKTKRVRPRISSFSKVIDRASNDRLSALVSPTRIPAGFNIITTSHVGVGWGNYWEARRHRLQFDIQKRFGVPANAIIRPQNQGQNNTQQANMQSNGNFSDALDIQD